MSGTLSKRVVVDTANGRSLPAPMCTPKSDLYVLILERLSN
jgi:hypothetical protein